jgi:DNA-binding NtrC family response regulator
VTVRGEPTTLMCWHSEGHGFEVVRGAIQLLRAEGVVVERVRYLVERGAKVTEGDVRKQTGVAEVLLHRLTLAGPTRHADIYRAVRDEVLPTVGRCAHLHVNVSPGTPAMHAVWLVLHAAGAMPEGTRLWSSQVDRRTDRRWIDPVAFDVNTYLAEIRAAQRATPSTPTYDPEPRSEARLRFLERLHRYAALPGAPLLVLGERGTGKTRLVEEHVARIRQRAVTTVACGALEGADARLAEAELFGYEKGAFSGATARREGLIDAAAGGILFLDEVQDLPRALQRKVVRVLQGPPRRFRRVGGVAEVVVDFDVVCASNLPEGELAARIDADLLDRIGLLSVRVPPLRECREDLLGDWRHVWAAMRQAATLPEEAPVTDALRARLRNDPLLGNLRDLQALALRTMAWWPTRGVGALATAIDEWPVAAGEASVTHALSFGDGTREDRVAAFCGALAREAYARWGSWKRAGRELRCNEKTLREDAKR